MYFFWIPKTDIGDMKREGTQGREKWRYMCLTRQHDWNFLEEKGHCSFSFISPEVPSRVPCNSKSSVSPWCDRKKQRHHSKAGFILNNIMTNREPQISKLFLKDLEISYFSNHSNFLKTHLILSNLKITNTESQLGYRGFVSVSFKNNELHFSSWNMTKIWDMQ